MGNITLVTGGAKSGKSGFALSTGNDYSGKKIFIATAQAFDSEMAEKIEHHKLERTNEWQTYETDHKQPEKSLLKFLATESKTSGNCVILIDCLTLWLSNIILNRTDQIISEEYLFNTIDRFVEIMKASDAKFILVTNEVGNSIIPENALARRFRDLSGQMNKKIAQNANELYLVVCGIPLKIK